MANDSKSIVNTGDWLMVAPAKGKENLYQKCIQLTGSVHVHDELLLVSGGSIRTGNARVPFFRIDDFEERIHQADKGNIDMAIFRWKEFARRKNSKAYDYFRFVTQCRMNVLNDYKLPYDKTAILSHTRNYIRAKLREYLPIFGNLIKHTEHHVYCTEWAWDCYKAGGVNLSEYVGNQPLPAPIHLERLYYAGYFETIANWHLIERLESKRA